MKLRHHSGGFMNTLLVVMGLFMATTTMADEISCPILVCEDPALDGPIDYDLCWHVTDEQPMKTIRSHNCEWYIA